MKWGIGEALFNNEINSSWGTLELYRFGGGILSLQEPLIATSIAFDSVVFYYIYEKQTMCDWNWLLLFREESWGIFRMAYYIPVLK